MEKEIDIEILPDGTVKIDMIGYNGNGCDIDLNKIAKNLGKISNSSKKQDYYKCGKTVIKQTRR